MLNLILAWKTPNWNTETPDIAYCGNDGTAAAKAAQDAHKSGRYVKGKVGRAVITTLIPVAPSNAITTPKAILAAKTDVKTATPVAKSK